MSKEVNLLENDIRSVLIKLSLPMIAANFVQTAFGLINMIWIGALGSGAVSSVGTATFYLNLATAISTLITVGVGIKYAQALGAKNQNESENYIKGSLILTSIIAVLYFLITFTFAKPFIHFYQLNDTSVVQNAINYLRHSLISTPLLFFSLTLTTLLTSQGKTKVTFYANTAGLLVNIILDPILIFGIGSLFPGFGINGAAWATNIARLVTFLILFYSMRHELSISMKFWKYLDEIKTIMKLGIPVTFQRVIFIFISMYLARIISSFGTDAIAAQKIGLQIESISYVTIGGLQGALAAFVGQNFGAKLFQRIKDGYAQAIKLAVIFSLIVTSVFLIFPGKLFGIFIDEPGVIDVGIGYMRAIGISQLFMCIEYITVGVFNGIGRTYIPPIVSVILTGMRIPLALLLTPLIGVDGIWWSISISSILKGTILYIWMKIILSKGEQYEKNQSI